MQRIKKLLLLICTAFLTVYVKAQQGDGNAGINQATQLVKSYFSTGTTLLYAIGAIVGLVGATKVYSKWNSGDQDTSKVAASWFGSCIFLVVVATVLKSFFGV
jgi:hypothetical protein